MESLDQQDLAIISLKIWNNDIIIQKNCQEMVCNLVKNQ